MRRERSAARPGWQETVAAQGLPYHTPEGRTYWDESVCYQFSAAEVDVIEKATNDLQEMCLEAAQFVIDNDRWAQFHIPPEAVPAIKDAWQAEPPSIYGRFDLAYDGANPPKLLEYNANTPTSLVEAAVIQWNWLQDTRPRSDQFNSIHEKLIAQWGEIRPYLKPGPLYMTGVEDAEDIMTLAYLEDTAQQAGIQTARIGIGDLGWNEGAREFRDLEERVVRNVFGLYPWEWLLGEYPEALLAVSGRDVWMEPIWKMLWSNKALLTILWELFPRHENLLETRMDGPGLMAEYVRKPLLSREGANIYLKTRAGVFETGGEYGEEGYVCQAAANIPNFGGNYPVIGSWLVTDQGACGMGIRESTGPITDNLSRFVPHYF
jgi:glutathionylspermidine synthase